MNDTQGNEIKVGQRVVYNMSGELHSGMVVKIVPRRGSGSRGYHTFHIQKLGTDHISKVKYPSSIFVL